MITPEMLSYVAYQLSDGRTREEVTQSLLASGWKSEDIVEALKEVPAKHHSGIALLSSQDLIHRAFTQYAQSWKPVSLTLFLTISASELLNLARSFLAGLEPQSALGPAINILTTIVSMGLVALGVLMVMVLLQDTNKQIPLKMAWQQALHFYFPFLGTTLLFFGALWAGSIPLFILGIYWGVAYSFAPFIVLFEGKRGLSALYQSSAYVHGYWRSVAWRMLQFYLFLIGVLFTELIVNMVLVSVAGFIASRLGLEYLFNSSGLTSLISGLTVMVGSMIIAPLTILYWILLYRDLQRIKGTILIPSTRREKILLLVVGAIGCFAFLLLLANGFFWH